MGLLSTLGTIGGAIATGGASLLPKAFEQDPEEEPGTGTFHYADGSKKYWKDPELASTLDTLVAEAPKVDGPVVAEPDAPVGELAPAVQPVDPRAAAKAAAAKLATGGKQTLEEGVAQTKAAQEAKAQATYQPAVQSQVVDGKAAAKEAAARLAGEGPKPASTPSPTPPAPEPEEAEEPGDFSEREAIEKADEEELARARMEDLEDAPDESPEAEKLEWKKPPALDDNVKDQTKNSYEANNMPASQDDIRKAISRVLGKDAKPETIDMLTRQAFVESNKGKNAPGYNLFGVKAKAGEPYVTAMTTEVDKDGNRVRVPAKFKAYGSLDESIKDRNALLQRLYPKAWSAAEAGDLDGFVAGLKRGGKSGLVEYMTEGEEMYKRALRNASAGELPPGYVRDPGGVIAHEVTGQPLPLKPAPAAPPGAPPTATGGASGAPAQARGVGSIGSVAELAAARAAGGASGLPPPNAEGLVLSQKQQTGGVSGAAAGLTPQQREAALRQNEAAYGQQAMAIRENTIRAAELQQQHADEYRSEMMARTQAATEQKRIEDGWVANVDRKMQDLAATKINPNKLYDDMGTFGSVLAHIGMFLGGAVSAVTHGPNYVMQYFQQAKEDNIQAQIKNKDSQYQDLVRQYGDHKAAAAALNLKMEEGFEARVKANLADEKSAETLARGRELLAANEINKQKSQQELRDALYGKEVKSYQEQLERPKGRDPLMADDLLKQSLAVRDLTTLQQTSEGGNTPLTHDEYSKEVSEYSKKTSTTDDFGNSIKRVAGRLGLTIKTDKNGRQVIEGKMPDVSVLPGEAKALLDADWSRITRADVMGMPREPSQELQEAFVKSTERPFWDDRLIPQLQSLLDIQNETQRLVDSDFHPLVVQRHRDRANLPIHVDALGNRAKASETPSLRLRGSSHPTVDPMGNPSSG